jgi:hypothetical protein
MRVGQCQIVLYILKYDHTEIGVIGHATVISKEPVSVYRHILYLEMCNYRNSRFQYFLVNFVL